MTQTEEVATAPPGVRRRARRRPRRRGPRWLDFSIAATALVVSTASLLVARHQAQVMDRQLAASVWPAVLSSAGYAPADADSGARLMFGLDNRGTGPARLRSHRVLFRGRPIRDREAFFEALFAGDVVDSANAGAGLDVRASQAFVTGRVLGTGEHVDWFVVRLPRSNDPRIGRLFEAASRAIREDFKSRVCYCSVLDDCWVAVTGEREPARVPSCEAERQQPQFN